MDLSGKTAFVTGSSGGIGLAIAWQLANCGCQLMLHSIGSYEMDDKALSEIHSSGNTRGGAINTWTLIRACDINL